MKDIDYSEENFQREWDKITYRFIQLTGKKPTMNSILFMIGIQELGKGKKPFSKEQKQDLMHIAICKVLSFSGYYEFEGYDQDGWPHWKNLQPVPKFDLEDQEKFLQAHIIDYFYRLDEDNNL